MRQIDSIARELKSKLCGEYNCYYHSVTIYLDTDDDELYAQFLEGKIKREEEEKQRKEEERIQKEKYDDYQARVDIIHADVEENPI